MKLPKGKHNKAASKSTNTKAGANRLKKTAPTRTKIQIGEEFGYDFEIDIEKEPTHVVRIEHTSIIQTEYEPKLNPRFEREVTIIAQHEPPKRIPRFEQTTTIIPEVEHKIIIDQVI